MSDETMTPALHEFLWGMYPYDENRPLISFLIPTRGRPKQICECIESIYRNAADPKRIEILLRVDRDDAETIKAVKNYSVYVYVDERGNGYLDLHNYYNFLGSKAKGAWLVCYNDDVRMLTPHYDEYVRRLCKTNPSNRVGLAAYCMVVKERPRSHEFMFIRRTVFEVLGHFGLLPAVDTWMFNVLSIVQAFDYFDQVEVSHNLDEKDALRKENTPMMSQLLTTICTAHTITARIADAMKLISYREWQMDLIRNNPPR